MREWSWLIWAGVAGTLLGLWRYLGSQPFGKKKPREEFEHGVHSLLILMVNGGFLQVKQRDSPVVIKVVRAEGEGDEATVLLQVPRAPWSEAQQLRLQEAVVSSGINATQVSQSTNEVVLELRFAVENIWVAWSGAKVARGAHLILDALSVPPNALFDFSLHGGRSARFMKRGGKGL